MFRISWLSHRKSDGVSRKTNRIAWDILGDEWYPMGHLEQQIGPHGTSNEDIG